MDVKRIFSCGVTGQVFETKFSELAKDNQHRLERVARRIGVSLKLRYELAVQRNPFTSPHDEFLLNHIELPSLEIYLLVTCLDTLAGQPSYVDFRDWLEKQPDFGQIGVKKIADLFSKYQEEYGVSRNFRKLFRNLPACLKEWLSQNVSIREVDSALNPSQQDPEVLIERLCTYFYDIRRNAYTHGSIARQVSTAEDIFMPQGDSWWVTPAVGTHFVLNKRNSRKRWNFSYRQGIDEATILRLIIHSAALQILNIEVTQDLMLLNLKNYSRMDALYSFVGEVTYNTNLLKTWQKIDDARDSDFGSHLIFVGVPTLSEQASSRMIDRYELQHGWEQGFKQMTAQYLNEVRILNTIISKFNRENPHLHSTQGDIEGHWQIVKNFLKQQTSLPLYKSLLKWSTIAGMTNLWLIIRDPCYT